MVLHLYLTLARWIVSFHSGFRASILLSLFYFFAVASLYFENPPQHLEVKVGQTARVTCFFTGSPPVVSCWIRNKEEVSFKA